MSLQEKGLPLGRSAPSQDYGSSTFSDEIATSYRTLSQAQGMLWLFTFEFLC